MTQSLLVALPCHLGDFDQAESLMKWMIELGPMREHNLLLSADGEVPPERVKALLDVARPHFNSVVAMIVQTGIKGWPAAANLMFRATARQIWDRYKLPWLWLEPDAVPLREGWLDAIGEAYQRSPRPVLGHILDAERHIDGLPDRYVAGVAVYPQDLFAILSKQWTNPMFTGPTKPNPKLSMEQRALNVRAWDMVFSETLVPRAHNTPLIQHWWGTEYGMAPKFVTLRTEADPVNAVTLDLVRKEAVLFHRVKDLAGFLALWRTRLEYQKAVLVDSIRQPGESSAAIDKALGPTISAPKRKGNPNWRKKEPELATA